MSSWSGDIANEDSATEALILQLIAEDFGIPHREDPPDPAVDSEDEPSGNEASSSADLGDRPCPRRGSVKNLDEHSSLEQSEEHPQTITRVQGLSHPPTPSHLEHPTSTSQTSNIDASDSNTMPKRNVEAAELSPYSVDDLETFENNSSSGMPPVNGALSIRPGRSTNENSQLNLQAPLTNPNKRPRVAGNSRSSSRQERPRHKDIAKHDQQATLSDHNSNFAQHDQHITTRNDHDLDMQRDKPLSQPHPGAQPSADEATTMNNWGNVRSELEGLQGFGYRHYDDHSETALSRMQSQNTNVGPPLRAREWEFHEEYPQSPIRMLDSQLDPNVGQPRGAKEWNFHEEYPQSTIKMSDRQLDPDWRDPFGSSHFHEEYPQSTVKMPNRQVDPNRRDPFGSNHKEMPLGSEAQNAGRRLLPFGPGPFGGNHKDYPTQQATRGGMWTGLPHRPNHAVFDEKSDHEAQAFKSQCSSNAISPYDDEWHDETAEARASRIINQARADVDAGLGIHQPSVRYEGKLWKYFQVPWAGKPGWMESYVDDISYEALIDPGDHGGRRYRGPNPGQLEDNRRRKTGEQPVDIFVGEDETLVGNFRAITSCFGSLARETCLTTPHLPTNEKSDAKIYYRTASLET